MSGVNISVMILGCMVNMVKLDPMATKYRACPPRIRKKYQQYDRYFSLWSVLLGSREATDIGYSGKSLVLPG